MNVETTEVGHSTVDNQQLSVIPSARVDQLPPNRTWSACEPNSRSAQPPSCPHTEPQHRPNGINPDLDPHAVARPGAQPSDDRPTRFVRRKQVHFKTNGFSLAASMSPHIEA